MLTQKQLSGRQLEKYIARFAELMGLGSLYDHNNFDSSAYPLDNHNVVDAVITNDSIIEMSNPKPTTWMTDEIMLKKVDYFVRADPRHLLKWFFIISFAVFSEYIKTVMDKLGITLIILNDYASSTNKATFIRHLFKSKLYAVFKRISPRTKKSRSSIHTSTTTLTQYSVNPSVSQASPIENNNLHQHREVEEDEQILAYLREVVRPKWIEQQLKQLEANGGDLES